MGLLNSALHIGRNAILGTQNALQIVGGNVSGAASPDFTRLTPQLDPLQGTLESQGVQPGAGVALTGIRRHIDEALESRLRITIGEVESASVQRDALSRLEMLFDDASGTGLGTQIETFLHSFDDLSNSPEDPATRNLVVAAGEQLAESIRGLRTQLARLGEESDQRVEDLVKQADGIAGQIAELNEAITTAEGSAPGEATGLRDRRDGLLRELSELFSVSVRTQPDGSMNVYIGSETLIQGNRNRPLISVREVTSEGVRTSVRFGDTDASVSVRGGQLGGVIASRDSLGLDQIETLDELARAIIQDVNRIHADGQGQQGIRSLIGSSAVVSPSAVLNDSSAGLAFPPVNGSFFITVADDLTATPRAFRIDVDLDGVGDDDATLESLVAQINSTTVGVTARVTADNRLAIDADAGFSFTFGHDGQNAQPDTSGVLAALGVNTFFTGRDARDIGVHELILSEPMALASAASFLSGDGSIASRIAALDDQPSGRLGEVSLLEFYNAISTTVAVAASNMDTELDAARAVNLSLQAQRERVSGVNLDEEAISLIKFQRAFEGAARFVRVVDDMISELISLIR